MADFGPAGGRGGTSFDDLTQLGLEPSTTRIIGLIVASGVYVDSIRPIYLDGNGNLALPKHGGTGGSEMTLGMKPGEFITEISGRSGAYVDSLTIETNQGRRLSFGGPGGGPVGGYDFPPEDGHQEVVAFFGGSGAYHDRVGIHTRRHP